MNLQALLVLSILSLGGAAAAAPAPAATQAGGSGMRDGLVAVHSRNLDQVELLPNAKLASYRRVIIDPVQVAFHKDWLGSVNDTRHVARITSDDVRRIAEETAAGMASSFAAAVKAGGYAIAAAPEAGVLRLSPRIIDLYINAPDILPPGRTRSFAREAGEATLVLEARDAVSGTLLGRVVDSSTARTSTLRLTQATSASNNFWFDAMFQRWAANCVAVLEAGNAGPRPSAAPATAR